MFGWSDRRRFAGAALAALAATAAGSAARAQVPDVCPPGEPGCAVAVLSAADARARAALVASGGSPVPGSASTLGRRTAHSRRATAAARLSLGPASTFRSAPVPGGTVRDGALVALAVDGAIALFDGFFAAPTVGGVLSIDALGSLGWVGGGGPIEIDGGLTWAVGARVGVFRESFTLPGLAVSVMYRGIGSLAVVDSAAPTWSADADALAVRATLGKRLGGVDAFAGVAWDRSDGSLGVSYVNQSAVREEAIVRDHSEARWAGFGGLGYTFLVFQLAAEAGWQGGGEGYAEEGFEIGASKGRPFGSVSFRFTY
ncbi:MAG TPA: hypothetical protein VML95_11900 [Longimicrobiales bacterium]|nr:hypothetical protein [Longimicrobiales bacterium]